MSYPASKQDLLKHAKEQGADDNAMSVFEQISDNEYETPADVSKAIGAID